MKTKKKAAKPNSIKTVTLINHEGESCCVTPEPLVLIGERLFRDSDIKNARKPNGDKIWKNLKTFKAHLQLAFRNQRIELADYTTDDERVDNCLILAYEICVFEYVMAFIEKWAEQSPNTRTLVIPRLGLITEPYFPDAHTGNVNTINIVRVSQGASADVKRVEKIVEKVVEKVVEVERPSRLRKMVSNLKQRVRNAIRGARNSIADSIAAK